MITKGQLIGCVLVGFAAALVQGAGTSTIVLLAGVVLAFIAGGAFALGCTLEE